MSIKNLFSDLMDEKQEEIFNEIKVPVKRTATVKRRVRIGRIKAQRGTNFKSLKPKKGWKRERVGKHYIRVRQTALERRRKKQVGKVVGRKKF